MTITDERKQAIDFSDPYFDASQALLVKKGSGVKALEDLKGKKIGVQLETTGEKYANDNAAQFGYTVVQYEDLPLMETAVRTGAVDAAINDNGVLYDYVKEFPDTEVTKEFDTGESYGIGLKKGNSALKAKVDDVLKKAKESGEYDKIYEKWFGKKPESK
jgi:polar amino acid transport system substrate-binding protein